MALFPSSAWLQALMDKLNTDPRYGEIARNWEGDMAFHIEPGGSLTQPVYYYIDLWHGKCRGVAVLTSLAEKKAAFVLKAPYDHYVRLLKGELDPMQALLTRKLGVQGSMAVLMKNVPTVLDFVRCCKSVTDGVL
jgi:putative sterol carrier protein